LRREHKLSEFAGEIYPKLLGSLGHVTVWRVNCSPGLIDGTVN
jgi:hypothetical protein